MANTFVKIATVTVGAGGASNITFSSIVGTYTDLFLCHSTRSVSTGIAQASIVRFNGDTTSTNYTARRLLGSGSAASSDQTPTISSGGFTNNSSATASTFSSTSIYIPNYTSSNSKSLSIDTVTENNATEAYMALLAMRWSGTAAITSIVITNESGGNFAQYSSATLYGISKS